MSEVTFGRLLALRKRPAARERKASKGSIPPLCIGQHINAM